MLPRDFTPSPHAIQAQAAIDIAAPPEQVASIYLDVAKWSETFPATIEKARVLETGANRIQVEVTHKFEGRVSNTLEILSPTEIVLEERKQRFDATFLNQFQPAAGGGTRYTLTASIRLRGIFRLLQPFLAGYVRRRALAQINDYVLHPLKAAAESQKTVAEVKSEVR